MSYSEEKLNKVYDRTSGKCHICHKKLAFSNYGTVGARAAWEVEHSVPKANGGTDHMNNLYAACIPCNCSKGASTTRAARAKNGKTVAPLSTKQYKKAQTNHTIAGGGVGAVIGGLVAGRPGAFIGGALGALFSNNANSA